MTDRVSDGNGWFEIKKNPISKAGVFPYLGSSIGAPDPDKIYQVLRPEEELSDPETIESFKLLPWINNHVMLGNPDESPIPVTPAEKKGVEGTTGETVVFENGILYATIKVFSEKLKKLLDSGKNELSAGYRCKWDFTSGNYNGMPYDAIQRDIRGNHLALVDEGRMGKEVAVLDSSDDCFYFALDSNEEFTMENEKDKAQDMDMPEEMKVMVKAMIMEVLNELKDGGGKEVEEKIEMTEVEDMGEHSEDEFGGKKGDESKSDRDYEGDAKDESSEDESEAMDAMDKRIKQLEKVKQPSMKDMSRQLAARNNLHKKVAPVVGHFACDEMDVNDVASYACDKLDIKCQKGHEVTAIESYLAAQKNTGMAFSLDSADSQAQGDSFVDNHYNADA